MLMSVDTNVHITCRNPIILVPWSLICHTRPIHEAHIDDILSASIPKQDVFGRSSDLPPRRERLPSFDC